jgi:hypothetical protein
MLRHEESDGMLRQEPPVIVSASTDMAGLSQPAPFKKQQRSGFRGAPADAQHAIGIEHVL